MVEKEILTALEVAKILGKHPTSVTKWLKAGSFPHAYRIDPTRRRSAWRIPKSDVDEFIQKRRNLRGYFYVPPPIIEPEPEAV